jgi:phosphatidylglycerol:prolipoprotein diacylglycerol transferase
MRPVLFRWRGLTVYSYPAMLYVGLVFGIAAGNVAAHVAGLDTFHVFVATCVLIVPALVGARLLHVFSHWDVYRDNRSRIWDRSEGGQAMYGGFLIAVPLSVPLLAVLHLPFGAFWDIASFTMLVGMMFTRIGCLLNGCCAGRPSTVWGSMYLPDHLGTWEKRIPTQLLEAGWAVALLALSIWIWPRLPFPGGLFLFVSAGYACGRLILESTRDFGRAGRRFTLHHAISVLIIALSLVALTGRGLM